LRKNADCFAENCRKSQKIVIMTSTPDWTNVRSLFENCRSIPNTILGYFYPLSRLCIIFDKMYWATFWAIFPQTRLVTLELTCNPFVVHMHGYICGQQMWPKAPRIQPISELASARRANLCLHTYFSREDAELLETAVNLILSDAKTFKTYSKFRQYCSYICYFCKFWGRCFDI
jgi:hypothetical protein